MVSCGAITISVFISTIDQLILLRIDFLDINRPQILSSGYYWTWLNFQDFKNTSIPSSPFTISPASSLCNQQMLVSRSNLQKPAKTPISFGIIRQPLHQERFQSSLLCIWYCLEPNLSWLSSTELVTLRCVKIPGSGVPRTRLGCPAIVIFLEGFLGSGSLGFWPLVYCTLLSWWPFSSKSTASAEAPDGKEAKTTTILVAPKVRLGVLNSHS